SPTPTDWSNSSIATPAGTTSKATPTTTPSVNTAGSTSMASTPGAPTPPTGSAPTGAPTANTPGSTSNTTSDSSTSTRGSGSSIVARRSVDDNRTTPTDPNRPRTAAELYRDAEAALARHDAAAADHALARLLADDPHSPLADQALYERARIAYQRRAWSEARRHLDALASIA